MASTPAWLQDRIRDYYRATTVRNFLWHWCGPSLALHLGLSRGGPHSLEDAHVNTNAELAERAAIGPGTRVLDAGCGVGGTALWLAEHRGAEVVGVTLEPEQCELACRFAVERGLADRVRFEVMDFAATTFPAERFDVIATIESLSHALDVSGFFAHALALLAPGGRLACFDYFRGEGGDAAAAQAMCEGWILPNLRRLAEAAVALAEAGFVRVEAVDRTESALGPATALERVGWRGLLLLAREGLHGDAGESLRRGNALGAIGAARGLASGSVRYGFLLGHRP